MDLNSPPAMGLGVPAVLVGRRIVLVPQSPQLPDAWIDFYFALKSDPVAMHHLAAGGVPLMASRQAAIADLEDRAAVNAAGEAGNYLILAPTASDMPAVVTWASIASDSAAWTPVGVVGQPRWIASPDTAVFHDAVTPRAEMGLMVSPHFQGRGIAHEALFLAISATFDHAKFNGTEPVVSMWFRTTKCNTAMRGWCERILGVAGERWVEGAARVGLTGEWVQYAMTRADWESAVKDRLQDKVTAAVLKHSHIL
ncbi:hypothetical protein H9P43_007455 [Blastocladiella emersonii ATCC 22665]|nr:hypothetical protein H9P43_007444 [Blastocladiella emersonii ATCC 22665]KAI9173324.1 hypothetical protein H9P43_007455 [Blastocladiella emersonii ATCC 22665]